MNQGDKEPIELFTDEPGIKTQAELMRRVALLQDPHAVYINMLRGTIAKPSLARMKELYGIK